MPECCSPKADYSRFGAAGGKKHWHSRNLAQVSNLVSSVSVTDEEEAGSPEPAEIMLQRVHSLIRQAHEQSMGQSRTQEVGNPPLPQAERAASWQGLSVQSMPQAVPLSRKRILQSVVPIQTRPAVVPVQVDIRQIAGMQAAPQANFVQTACRVVPLQLGVLLPPPSHSKQTTLAQAAAEQSLRQHFGIELPAGGWQANHPTSASMGAAIEHVCNPCVLATSRHGCHSGDSCRFCHSPTDCS